MKKYLAIIKTECLRQLAYRSNYFSYRFGSFFEILIQIVIWTTIFQKTTIISGYSYREMMTYILIGWLLSFFMANFGFENIISKHIQRGELSNFISKPINYVYYIIALSIGRSSIALVFAFFMNLILLLIFSKNIIISADIIIWLVLLAMIFVGYFIKLFISILIGFVSFWTVDNSGIFYSINTFAKFLSGAYFPINILPAVFLNFSLALPFIYTFYFPAQLYLGKISIRQGLVGLGLEIAWLVILYIAIKIVWKMGLKKYESVGI